MKMIHGFVLALTLLITSSVVAQDAAAPPTPAPAPELTPAPEPKAEPAPKKSKKADAPAASSQKNTTIVFINPPETAVVKNENVNVRGRASFIGEVITKLNKGETVTLLEEITLGKTKKNEPANWFRIAMPTNTPVWVNANYIDAATKTVKPKKLQVRAGPGENFSVIGDLEKGETVKEIRTVEEWMEIEPPTDAYAFVAANFIDRTQTAPVAPVVPEPAPEVVQVPAPPETPAPAEPVAPTEPAAPAEPVAPPVVTEPVVEEPLPKRIVSREGIIRRSLNVQTPSYYELENIETKKVINYLYSSQPGFTLKTLIGARVIVTGEELIDKRWRNTPVIEIESLQTVEAP